MGAGINSATPYLDISAEAFGRILDVNLKSVHLGCQIIGGRWTEQGRGGSSSMSAVRPLSRVFTYSVSKAGIWNPTQNPARELAPQGYPRKCLVPRVFPGRAKPQGVGSGTHCSHHAPDAHGAIR
jgi:NAD(P)-dependent dehydrogenase (short-subunit alcohol dehydrogenase family)